MFWPALHEPIALISGLEAFADSLSIISSVTGCNSGSVSTSLSILENISASKVLKSLWQMVSKPPTLQSSPFVMLYCWPQGHIAGKPFKRLPYLKLKASLNSPLFRAKPNSVKGNTLSHEEAPGIFASCIAFKI